MNYDRACLGIVHHRGIKNRATMHLIRRAAAMAPHLRPCTTSCARDSTETASPNHIPHLLPQMRNYQDGQRRNGPGGIQKLSNLNHLCEKPKIQMVHEVRPQIYTRISKRCCVNGRTTGVGSCVSGQVAVRIWCQEMGSVVFGKPTFMTALGLFVCLRAGAKNKIAEEI